MTASDIEVQSAGKLYFQKSVRYACSLKLSTLRVLYSTATVHGTVYTVLYCTSTSTSTVQYCIIPVLSYCHTVYTVTRKVW